MHVYTLPELLLSIFHFHTSVNKLLANNNNNANNCITTSKMNIPICWTLDRLTQTHSESIGDSLEKHSPRRECNAMKIILLSRRCALNALHFPHNNEIHMERKLSPRPWPCPWAVKFASLVWLTGLECMTA